MPYLASGDVRPFALQVLLSLGVAPVVVALYGARHLSQRERVTAGAADKEMMA